MEGKGFGAEVVGESWEETASQVLQPAAIVTRQLLLLAEVLTIGAEVPPTPQSDGVSAKPTGPAHSPQPKAAFFVFLKQSKHSALTGPWWGVSTEAPSSPPHRRCPGPRFTCRRGAVPS